MRIAGAQLNLAVGDFRENERRILDSMAWAAEQEADILLLPELAIPGYPPEDLIHRNGFVAQNLETLHRLARASGAVATIVGFVAEVEPEREGDSMIRRYANAAAVLHQGEIVGVYSKVLLPNYGVFDEERYFVPGDTPSATWEIAGVRCGISVCEDIWASNGPPARQAEAGARILLNINASPYHRGKAEERELMLRERARSAQVPVVYLNLVGGQDELVFDGASLVLDAVGQVLHRSPQFAEDRFVVEVPVGGAAGEPCCVAPLLDSVDEVYAALVTGLGDYVRKNGFSSVVVGLSGGIDSALTAAVAADALGPSNVWGISMPSRFSSEGSVSDSRALATNLGIRFDVIPMDAIFSEYLEALSGIFGDQAFGTAEENLQARTRGAILMAASNKLGPMVVATGNKSEMAAGYATLYGDMVGGFAVLKDVFKTLVYQLARRRNLNGEVIPEATISKPPSAELRPDQRDSDSLPAYEVLDAVLERYIEDDMGVDEIVADGFDRQLVVDIAGMVDRNEYKRRQSAPGVKITTKAFGRDRRLPITNFYRRD